MHDNTGTSGNNSEERGDTGVASSKQWRGCEDKYTFSKRKAYSHHRNTQEQHIFKDLPISCVADVEDDCVPLESGRRSSQLCDSEYVTSASGPLFHLKLGIMLTLAASSPTGEKAKRQTGYRNKLVQLIGGTKIYPELSNLQFKITLIISIYNWDNWWILSTIMVFQNHSNGRVKIELGKKWIKGDVIVVIISQNNNGPM